MTTHQDTYPAICIYTDILCMLRITHGICIVIATLLLALAKPVQADPGVPDLILGTTTNGIRDVSKQEMELSFNSAIASYSTRNGINTKLKVFDSEDALMAAFDQGEIDGILGLATNVLAVEDKIKPKMISAVYENGQYKFRYLLMVRKADNISSIEQLKGKRIGVPKFQEIESLYLETLLLRRKQVESAQFFSQIINATNSNVTITDLFFNRVDAAIINENEYLTAVELNPQIAQKTMILAQSEAFVSLVGAIRKTYPADLEQRALTAATEFTKTEAGRNTSKIIGIKRLQIIYANDLDTLRALKSEYDQLKNAKSKAEAKSPLPVQQKPSHKSNAVLQKTP